jgi:hypothetical protein
MFGPARGDQHSSHAPPKAGDILVVVHPSAPGFDTMFRMPCGCDILFVAPSPTINPRCLACDGPLVTQGVNPEARALWPSRILVADYRGCAKSEINLNSSSGIP